MNNLNNILNYLELEDEIKSELNRQNITLINDEKVLNDFFKSINCSTHIYKNYSNELISYITIWDKLTWEQYLELKNLGNLKVRSKDFKKYSRPETEYEFNYYNSRGFIYFFKFTSYSVSESKQYLNRLKQLLKNKFNFSLTISTNVNVFYDDYMILGLSENKNKLFYSLICAKNINNNINIISIMLNQPLSKQKYLTDHMLNIKKEKINKFLEYYKS